MSDATEQKATENTAESKSPGIGKSRVEMTEAETGLPQGIRISGTKEGLVIVWDDGLTFSQARALLKKEFKKAPYFYQDAVAQIGFESRILAAKQEKQLRELCKEFGVLFQKLPVNYKEQLSQANTYMVAKNLRSGQKVEFNGHVVILGDVHPGAEVVAAGHIIVWGALRGTVHAGAAGNDKATVCAMRLMPTQLRIANFVAVTDQDKDAHQQAEIASIRNDAIMAEPWDAKSFVKLGIALEN